MKVLVIGFEQEWLKYFNEVLILPNLDEVQFRLDMGGSLTIYKNRKLFEPDVVLYRRIPKTDLDKRFVSMLRDFKGVVINKPETIINANQIYHSLNMLKDKGIKIPDSVCFYGHKVINPDKVKYPAVLKIEGEHAGNGKALIKDKEELQEAINLLVSSSRKYMLQEYVKLVRDFRVLVVGNKVVDVVNRVSRNWKKNVSTVPEPVHFRIKELEKLALNAAKHLNADLAGVDILETEDNYFVLEVNTEPGIEYFGEDAYKAIAEYAGECYGKG